MLNVPIFVISRDRVNYLLKTLSWLNGLRDRSKTPIDIVIVDNDSTYPPLLKYLNFWENEGIYKVFRTGKNDSFTAPWGLGKPWYQENYGVFDYFGVTCNDLDFTGVPFDWVDVAIEVLNKHPEINKVGMGIKIKDIPDHYQYKAEVLVHESPYFKKTWRKDRRFYFAMVDTAMSIMRSCAPYGQWTNNLRGKPPYEMRHLPWYEDETMLPDDVIYYKKNLRAIGTSWNRYV